MLTRVDVLPFFERVMVSVGQHIQTSVLAT